MKRLITIAMILMLGLTTQSWAAEGEGKKDGQCKKGEGKGKKGKGLSAEQREQVKNMSDEERKEFFQARRAKGEGKRGGKRGGKKKEAAE